MPRKTKKKSGGSKSAARTQKSLFPPGYEEKESKFTWWKPESEDDTLAGTVVRFDQKDLPVLDIGGGETRGLPEHTMLTDKLLDLEVGDEVMIVCINVGTGKGNPYDYRVGVKKGE